MCLCQSCKGFIATRYFNQVPVCFNCFTRLDARLLAEKQTAAKAQVERDLLECWYRLPSAEMGR